MTTEQTTPGRDAQVVPLRAVQAAPGQDLGQSPAPPLYATADGPERKPILPPQLASIDAARHHARRAAGAAKHSALYHGLRSPAYLARTLAYALVGLLRLAVRWARWCLFPVPVAVYADAIADGHRAWHRTHAVHRETVKIRLIASAVILTLAALGLALAVRRVPVWAWPLAGAVLLPLLAKAGRPEGRRIVQPAHVPPQYTALTQDVIVRALGSLGLAGVNTWLREGREIVFAGPVRQDGPGWRAEIDLPYGVTAAQVIERREQLASGLRRPLGAVWPEPVTAEHEGRLELWVGQQDASRAKAPPWPLLRSGAADVFKPLPFAVDVRGRRVSAPLIYHNWLIGSIPRQGKTAAVRCLACAIALDPLAEMWVHELKGTGDLDPMEQVAYRFASGIDDEAIGYAAESLRLLRAEVERRSPRVRSLPLALCPEKRVTREIAGRRSLQLWPVACVIDECQNLFAHPRFGKQAAEDAEFVIKVGPAMGLSLILATQRPDRNSLPTGVSANVSIRFCLKVMGQVENDMILGTSAYKNGIRATTFRAEVDAGIGYLLGATAAPLVCRTYFLDVPAARAVAARARALRERAGTLSGAAAGQDTGDAPMDALADAIAAMGADTALHWSVLAERLAARWPERWADATAESVSARLRSLGARSVQVNRGGENRQGVRLADLQALQS